MRALADDGAPDQVRLADDQFDEFFFRGQLFGKAAFLVDSVSGIEELRDRVIAKNIFYLFGGQRLFRIIAFDEIVAGQFAQETSCVATGRSSALVPEI